MNGWITDISLWQFPASLILGTAFILAIWWLHRYYRQSRLYRLLSSGITAVVLLLTAALALAVDGTWAVGIHHTYPFILLVLLLATNLGFAVLRRLHQRDAGFLLNHTGLFLILWGAAFGAPDITQARMVLRQGETSRTAYTPQGELVPLPFEVHLERFVIEYYDDGATPRQFRSEIAIKGTPFLTEVNAPARYDSYSIYQDSYDTARGSYTVLLLVRDPWLWVVWLGTALLAAGSLILLLRKR